MTPELLAMCELVMERKKMVDARHAELDGSAAAQLAYDRSIMAWDMAVIAYNLALKFDVEAALS